MTEQLKQKTLLYAEDDIVTQTLYKEYFEQFFKTVYLVLGDIHSRNDFNSFFRFMAEVCKFASAVWSNDSNS